jgi:hypothetical protein
LVDVDYCLEKIRVVYIPFVTFLEKARFKLCCCLHSMSRNFCIVAHTLLALATCPFPHFLKCSTTSQKTSHALCVNQRDPNLPLRCVAGILDTCFYFCPVSFPSVLMHTLRIIPRGDTALRSESGCNIHFFHIMVRRGWKLQMTREVGRLLRRWR